MEDEPRQTAIELAPAVAHLRRQPIPRLGLCRYEFNPCDRGGSRVYSTGGVEIAMAAEAQFDRRVMRVRFKPSCPAAGGAPVGIASGVRVRMLR